MVFSHKNLTELHYKRAFVRFSYKYKTIYRYTQKLSSCFTDNMLHLNYKQQAVNSVLTNNRSLLQK
jgi:hypothetical protein